MSITTLAANYNLEYNFGQVAYTVPATLYMGLSTQTISNTGTGAVEPSGYGYARVAITNTQVASWNTASSNTVTNKVAITFPESTGSWGTITYIGLWDASTGGNIWYFQALSPTKIVQTSTTVIFAIGALTISMTN